ncbi:MAG: ferritin-like domain-containing protein [Rhodoferax sp.]|nr:ferritin-like domain-containing protein [Rhodoferax sp.]
MELRQSAWDAFCISDPTAKVSAIDAIWLAMPEIAVNGKSIFPERPPGRPEQPMLVLPKEVPRRSPFTPEGHLALMHSIAHIEFNAMHLALDAVWRFADLPESYYLDWVKVAHEEAGHFKLLAAHLETIGAKYGELPAHNGLWTLCEATKDDLCARMALVPCILEARGLDATPRIQEKLSHVHTPQAKAAIGILQVILDEEIGHVAIGNHWYRWLCARNGHNPQDYAKSIAKKFRAPKPKPPFNLGARQRAGFTDQEILELLQAT